MGSIVASNKGAKINYGLIVLISLYKASLLNLVKNSYRIVSNTRGTFVGNPTIHSMFYRSPFSHVGYITRFKAITF